MFEFLSSPFGLVAVGLGVLAVAVLALCLWITTLDRRMRGMADGLEAERRKVAEMQMVIGRRNNAARSYGRRGAPAGAPVPAQGHPMGAAPAQAMGAAPAPGAPVPGPGGAAPTARGVAPSPEAAMAGVPARGAASRPATQGAPAPSAPVQPGAPRPRHPQGRMPQGTAAQGAAPAPRPTAGGATRRRGGGWAPQQATPAADQAVDAWVQAGAGAQQAIVMPDKKMSRKARREAERAFAARAAAELEARQARRAQEVAVPRGTPRAGTPRPAQRERRPYGAPAPAPGPGAPAAAAPASGAPEAFGRGRHAR